MCEEAHGERCGVEDADLLFLEVGQHVGERRVVEAVVAVRLDLIDVEPVHHLSK